MFTELTHKFAPYYRSDFCDAFISGDATAKVVAATFYMFFASFAPAITLGSFLQTVTEYQLGPLEVLVSTFICGTIFSLLAGQGMVIVGVTGPVCIFCLTVYELSKMEFLEVPFLPWLACIAIWSCAMHMVLAVTGSCRLVSWVSPYACETFGTLIGIIYVWTAAEDSVNHFWNKDTGAKNGYEIGGPVTGGYGVIYCLLTYQIIATLDGMRESGYFNETIRGILASYAVPIGVLVGTGLSLIVRDSNIDVDVPRVNVKEVFEPTLASRSEWFINPGDAGMKGFWTAFFPAVVLTVLFFFDHNVSSLMAQGPEFNLQKPPTYNWDFFVVGLNILVCGLLGLPFTNGLIPQAPLHVAALSTKETQVDEKTGLKQLIVVRVEEQRLSNLIHACLIGVCCIPAVTGQLKLIPLSVLNGIFLFMGIGCFTGNGFITRCMLPFLDKDRRRVTADTGEKLEALMESAHGRKEVGLFTGIQLVFALGIYAVTKTAAGIAFPVLIAMLVGVRWGVLPKLFSEGCLIALDGEWKDDQPEINPDALPASQKLSALAPDTRTSARQSLNQAAAAPSSLSGDRHSARPSYRNKGLTAEIRHENNFLLEQSDRGNLDEKRLDRLSNRASNLRWSVRASQ